MSKKEKEQAPEQDKKKIKFRFPLWAKSLAVLIISVSVVSIVAINFFSSTVRSITRNFYVEQCVRVADSLGLYLDLDNVKAVKNKVDQIYQSIPEEEKVENSDWDSPEWYTYLEHYNEVASLDDEGNLQGMPEFMAIIDQLDAFYAVNEAKYTYVAYADFVNKRLVYLVDNSPVDDWCRPGSFDDFTAHDMSIFKDKTKGFTPEITNMPEYGYLCSVGRPIFDGEHTEDNIVAFALVDLSMDEIVAKENENTRTLVIILVSISVSSLLLGFLLIIFLMVRPVRKLTRVANSYTEGGDGDLNKFAQVRISTKDEIEDLSNSMKKMEGDINKYIDDLLATTTKLEGAVKKADDMKKLADRDALTGINNKRAYFEIEDRLNEEIRAGKANFAIAMIDLNDLKVTNDTLGHEKGDALIIAISQIIKKIFTKSPVYRVGGDEFVVVCEGEDLKNIEKLEKDFKKDIREVDTEVSAAIGVALFDPKTDNNVEDTFKRADKRMYEEKKIMKGASR